MKKFTFDTNCIIAIDQGGAEAKAIRALADAHLSGKANVAIVAISASEKQSEKTYLNDFGTFQKRLSRLKLDHLEIVLPMAYWDIAFWGHALWTDDTMREKEREIHSVLFSNVEFDWQDYCRKRSLDPNASPSGDWRNRKCDVQAIWSHIHHSRDVFITSDRNFHKLGKKPALIALGAGAIMYPQETLSLVEARTSSD